MYCLFYGICKFCYILIIAFINFRRTDLFRFQIFTNPGSDKTTTQMSLLFNHYNISNVNYLPMMYVYCLYIYVVTTHVHVFADLHKSLR